MSWFSKITKEIVGSEDFSELKSSSIRDFLNGNILMKNFLRKQYLLLIMIAVLSFIYIDNRLYCEKQLSRAIQLEKQVLDLKYESLTISSELMQISRQSSVQRMLQQRNIDLKESRTPPVMID